MRTYLAIDLNNAEEKEMPIFEARRCKLSNASNLIGISWRRQCIITAKIAIKPCARK